MKSKLVWDEWNIEHIEKHLTIIVSQEKQKESYVVSARDMSRKERRYYYEQTKTN